METNCNLDITSEFGNNLVVSKANKFLFHFLLLFLKNQFNQKLFKNKFTQILLLRSTDMREELQILPLYMYS